MQVTKTPTYPVMCRFPLFVALCDHNPDGRTDERMNVMLVASCIWHVAIKGVHGQKCWEPLIRAPIDDVFRVGVCYDYAYTVKNIRISTDILW